MLHGVFYPCPSAARHGTLPGRRSNMFVRFGMIGVRSSANPVPKLLVNRKWNRKNLQIHEGGRKCKKERRRLVKTKWKMSVNIGTPQPRTCLENNKKGVP
jgi:hypothetical protein